MMPETERVPSIAWRAGFLLAIVLTMLFTFIAERDRREHETLREIEARLARERQVSLAGCPPRSPHDTEIVVATIRTPEGQSPVLVGCARITHRLFILRNRP